MKKIVQNLLAVFLLAVLLVPVTALGAGCKPYAHVVDEGAETVWDWTIPNSGFASVTVSAQCKKCNETFSTTANSVAIQGKRNPTCTECGKKVYSVTVSLGGQKFYGEKAVDNPNAPAIGHSPQITIQGKAATCTETGLTDEKRCSRSNCNELLEEQKVIPATGHTEVTDAAVAATCTKTGLTEGSHCSVCNEVLVKQKVIPVTEHTVVTDAAVAATCTKTGLTEGSHCSVCNKVLTEQEVVPVKEHTVVADAAVEPTCTEAGWSGG